MPTRARSWTAAARSGRRSGCGCTATRRPLLEKWAASVAAATTPAAATVRAAVIARLALVPGDEQDPARPERADDARNEGAREVVDDAQLHVVPVVQRVGRDPGEARQRPVRQVVPKPGETRDIGRRV